MGTDATSATPEGWDADHPDANRHDFAAALLAEAKQHYNSVERFVVVMTTIEAGQLYKLLGYGTFEELCAKEFGVSRSTGKRWVQQGKELAAAAAQPAIGPGQSGPRREPSSVGVEKPTGPAISQREAARRARARRSGEEPGPVATDAERAAEAARKQAAAKPKAPPVAPQPAPPATPGEEPPGRKPRGPRQAPGQPSREYSPDASSTAPIDTTVAEPAAGYPIAGYPIDTPMVETPMPDDWEYPTAEAPGPPPGGDSAHLLEVLGVLGRYDPSALAGVATEAQATAIVTFAAHFIPASKKTVQATKVAVGAQKATKKTMARVEREDPDLAKCKTGKHPLTRRLGRDCGVPGCGATGLK